MKTIITLSLSFLVFFQGVGLGVSDVFMLTGFVEHAKFHSEEYGDDFFIFIEKHYGALKTEHHKTHQKEKSQHEKLPFQHNSFNHNLSEIVLINYEFALNRAISSFTTKHHFYYQDLYSFLERASIFQPPKIA